MDRAVVLIVQVSLALIYVLLKFRSSRFGKRLVLIFSKYSEGTWSITLCVGFAVCNCGFPWNSWHDNTQATCHPNQNFLGYVANALGVYESVACCQLSPCMTEPSA